ncbi:MAG: glycosyltransferase [Patescibacteria group bacterium]
MRILHVHKYFHDHDGASRYMIDVMNLQEKLGHSVAPFSMRDPRNLPSAWDKYFIANSDTSRVRWGLGLVKQLVTAAWSFEARRNMKAVVAAFKPDIVHIHNIYTHLSPSILGVCKAAGIPVVMTTHDYSLVSANYGLWDAARQRSIAPGAGILAVARTRFIKGSWLATFVLELIYAWQRQWRLYDRAIDKYLSPAKFVKDTLVAAKYSASKIEVLTLFASNLEFAETLREQTKKRSGVLFAGRLESYKGIDLFLQAANALPKTQFFVAGTGPDEELVREQARTSENLTYLGFLSGPELWRKMAEVEVVMVPSRWHEPYGLVSIEAMACGATVLVSDAGGLHEKIKDGVNGLVFKAGDEKDLISKLKQALKHPKDLERMGEGAYRYAKAQADPAKHVARILEVYSEILIHR